MNTTQHSQSSTTTIKTTKRYWRRRSEPHPWWPWGLLPLLLLLIPFLWGIFKSAPNIEEEVSQHVTTKLNNLGTRVISSTPSGQELEVFAESTTHKEALLESVAMGTQCNTWAGELTCPTDVSVKLKKLETAPVKAPIVPSPVKNRLHDFSFTRQANRITLNGEVPSKEIRNSINAEAKKNFAQVIDKLTISKELATSDYPLAYKKSLKILSDLRSGTASWKSGVFSVNGQVNAEKETAARNQFELVPAPKLGAITLNVVKSVDTCNAEFKNLLQVSTINFRTNSAEINPNSQELLVKLSALAKKCPGNLQVEGHTDSLGSDEYNQSLSQNRAEAVRTALAQLQVNTQRVKAIGYGETQPIADNNTRDGRAQNRRIVIKIAP